MTIGSVAKMVWGSTPTAQQPVAVAPTPNAATVTAGTSDLFTFGLPTGYTQKDLGDGRYEMFDTAGNSAGYGYKGVRDAIGELSYKNANAKTTNANGVWTNPYLQVAKSIWTDLEGKEMDVSGLQREQASNVYGLQDAFFKPAPTDGYGNPIGEREQVYARQSEKMVNQEFSSEDEIKKQLEKYKQVGNYNGVMGDWEALGQVLEGNVAPNPQEWGNLPTDQKEQIIKGDGILYGSTPVFSRDGQLIGYRADLTPNEAKDFNNGTDKAVQKDFGTFITHGGKSHSWNNANWRELSDPTAWQTNAVVGEGGTAFIPKGNEDKLSWTNKDSYAHQDTKNSFFGAVFDALDPIIDKLDPGHNWTQDQIKNLVGADSQKAAFEKVVPVVLAVVSWYFGGAGATAGGQAVSATASAANAVNAASKGDGIGAVLNAISGLGASGVLDSFMAGAGDAAKEVATAAGMSSDTQTALSTMAKGFMDGDLYKMTNKVIDLGGTANKVVGGAVSTAVKTAIKAGVSGAELEDVMKSALVGAMTSLVGGAVGAGTQQATGSGVLGTVAGTVAGNLTGSAIKDATADTPDPVSRPPAQKPTVTAPTLSNKYTGRMAKMIWS